MFRHDITAIRSGNHRALIGLALDAMIVLVPIGLMIAAILLHGAS